MRKMLVAAAGFVVGLAAVAATAPEVQRWLEGVDATRNAFAETIVSARASQLVNGKVDGSADFDVYLKGRQKALLVFRGGKNSGRKVLTSGEKMWLIVPGARRPLPITPNQRLLGGASFGDVAQLRFAEDFTAVRREGTESISGLECHVLDLTAKSPKGSYPRVTLWLDKVEHLPRQVLFFLPSGKAARRVNFTKFVQDRGKTMVAEMEVRELLGRESAAVTRIEYRDYRPARLDEKIFTPEGARGL